MPALKNNDPGCPSKNNRVRVSHVAKTTSLPQKKSFLGTTPVVRFLRRHSQGDWNIPTSSTAQGGGGSFKNRKPIGEVGCCESGMAERSHWWTERCLRSPLFLSLSLTIYLPTYLPIYLSILSIYLSIYLSLSLSSVYLSSCLPVYLSIYLSICLSVYLSICGAVSFSVM